MVALNSATHSLIKQDMAVFDNMAPCIRRVMREAPITTYLVLIFQQDPQLYDLAMRNPEEFARRLESWLAARSAEAHRLIPASLMKALKG